jgi:MFS family permease
MKSTAGFYITRGLIGVLEGAFAPLTVMCLSNFYTNKELGFRIAILSSGINVSFLVYCSHGMGSYITNP